MVNPGRGLGGGVAFDPRGGLCGSTERQINSAGAPAGAPADPWADLGSQVTAYLRSLHLADEG